MTINRRHFLGAAFAGTAGIAMNRGALAWQKGERPPSYRGPNVILIRFGGGARRLETIDPVHTYSPFLCHELIQRGTLYPRMGISSADGVGTGHGTGTLYLLTGRYDRYEDLEGRLFGERYEPKSPTLFEYLRKAYDVQEHETLIVNSEDRIDEEFYTFSNHHMFGVNYRSQVLSLYRFKAWLLEQRLAEKGHSDAELQEMRAKLQEFHSLDLRILERKERAPQIDRFWQRWREHYGDTGLVNPRGDRLLTELAVRALKELRPRFLTVNYQDCDYVHWGNAAHYTRGISIMDEGLARIVATVEADEEYRDNTVFVVVPDCGRDSNRLVSLPFQHHFDSRSSREIFALFFGAGIAKGEVIDREVDQIQVAGTLGRAMGLQTEVAEGEVLEEVFA